MRKVFVIGLTTMAIVAGGAAYAKDKYERHSHHMNYLAEKLELTPAQEKVLSEQMQANKEQHKEMKQQRRELRQTLMQLNPEAPDYQARLAKLTKEAEQLAREMVSTQAERQKTLFSVLTAEQRTELSELKHDWKEKKERRHGGKRCHD